MRIILMHNPKAGDAEHGRKQLMAALAKEGHRATYQSTKKSDYKKALKKPTDLVLSAGGDSTVAKVGRRLIDTGIPLSVLPLGMANNLARSLGFAAIDDFSPARLYIKQIANENRALPLLGENLRIISNRMNLEGMAPVLGFVGTVCWAIYF